MAAYPLNQPVRVSVAFTVSAVATDPTTVSLVVRDPSGTITTYTYAGGQITKDSTGNYHKDLTTGTAGTWTYSFVGTGACAAEDDGEFFVDPSTVD